MIHFVCSKRNYYSITIFLFVTTINFCSANICVDPEDKIWTFAFSNDGYPNDYVENGALVGQSVDLVNEVCKFKKKNCQPTLVQRRQCWDTTEGFPPYSEVLNGRYFDSCANYPESPERRMSYGFPEEHYFRAPFPSLVVSEKTKTTLNDLKTCNNLSLAYPANTALEPDCLFDAGLFVRDDRITGVLTEGISDLRTIMNKITEMVVLGEVDMGVVITRFTRVDEVRILEQLPCSFQISSGLTHMMRVEDTYFIDWWSEAVHEYMCSELYPKFCQESIEKYAVDPLCRVPGEDLDCSKFGGPKGKPAEDVTEPRIAPCVSEECRTRAILNIDTWRDGYFVLQDHDKRNPQKALEGSDEDYSGSENKRVVFVIEGRDAGLFRPDKICLTVKNVKNIKFTYRGGDKESQQLTVLVDFLTEWTTHCKNSLLFRRSVKIELTITKEFAFNKKDKRIRVRDLAVDACIQRAFITN